MADFAHPVAPALVHLTNADTGKIKSWPCSGQDDDGWEFEETALRLALNLVPDLVDAIMARGAGSIAINVRRLAS